MLRNELGETGVDHRGLWIDDPDTGTRARIGMVGLDMAYDLYARGEKRLAEEVVRKPRFGIFVSKTF